MKPRKDLKESIPRRYLKKQDLYKRKNKPISNKNLVKYVKVPKNWEDERVYSGLSREDSFELEIKCLKLLQKHYKCTCGLGKKEKHFPEILKVKPENLKIKMTWVGRSIHKYKKLKKDYHIPKLDKQIKCILNNLERAGVYHLDMHWTGKNLCLRDSGVLGLIDFDIAVIRERDVGNQGNQSFWPETAMLRKKYKRYASNNDYREYMTKCILRVCRCLAEPAACLAEPAEGR